jgi:uncharacterized protein (UPF0332 family)
MASVNENDASGRTAYLAAYHAAQALIFERIGKVLKTHNRVQSEFLRLTRGETLIDPALRGFLSSSYILKAIADYDTDPSNEIPPVRALEAIAMGRRFIINIVHLIGAVGQADCGRLRAAATAILWQPPSLGARTGRKLVRRLQGRATGVAFIKTIYV